jgi:hypothetical protein
MRTYRLLTAFVVILCVAASLAASAAGTFKDRDGGAHTWSVDDRHALTWDAAPYVPFGIVFEPRYLTAGQTDANWTADEQDISAFKLAGVNDIIIRPSTGLTTIPAEAVQRVIDLLEKNGLHYGLELYDPDYAPLVGYIVQPTANRVDSVVASGEVTQNLADADAAIYALVDAKTGELKDYGRKAVTDGRISAPVIIRNGAAHVMLFFPRKAIPSSNLFDVWRGFDQHRDRLIVTLRQIKFGKGLRFFIDPFGENFGISGDADYVIPSSTAFRFEYAAWLTKKYVSPGDLNVAWGVVKHDINSFDEATRLIPLWRDGRGAAAVYDEVMSKAYPTDAAQSAIWSDLKQFRADSVRAYMDAMADVAKRVSADVPVIYSATGLQPIFQSTSQVGYDGLVMPDADSNTASTVSGAHTLSLAEGSVRSMWMVSHLRPAGGVYGKKQDLFGAMNTAHDLGAKGFFVDDARGTGVDGADLVSWLAEYSNLSTNDKQFAVFKPRTVYYPEGTANAGIKKLSSGSWWLPSLIKGTDLYLGGNYAGYAVQDPQTFDTTICVWSLKGTQIMHLATQSGVTITNASGAKTDIKAKKGRVEFTVGTEPMFVHGVAAEEFMPIEVVMESVKELETTIARADQKHMDTSDYKSKLQDAKSMVNQNQLGLCLSLVHETVTEINQRLKGLQIIPSLGGSGDSGK